MDFGSASTAIGSMSLQLAIPWQVGLHQSLPPLHQPDSFSTSGWKLLPLTPKGGGIFNRQNTEFSIGIDRSIHSVVRQPTGLRRGQNFHDPGQILVPQEWRRTRKQ